MHLSTYDDHTPILDISAGSMTVAISVTDRKVGEAALEFVRELASKAALYAAEVERLHTQAQPGQRHERRRQRRERRGRFMVMVGRQERAFLPPRCLPLLAHVERS